MEKNKNFLTEEENIKINIVTENDEELSCDVVGIYEAGEYEYIALVPDNSDELYLYRYEEGEDGLKLDSIEDLDEMKLAEEVFWMCLEPMKKTLMKSIITVVAVATTNTKPFTNNF